MYFSRFRTIAGSLALSIVIATGAIADVWWNPDTWFRDQKVKKPDTLIVTSNYVKSRVLAELIQFRTGQPILLLPTGEDQKTMFVLGPNGESMMVKNDDYTKFVKVLNVKHVLFLGNTHYAPTKYIDAVSELATVWVVQHEEWPRIASSVSDLLDIEDLEQEYKDRIREIEEGTLPAEEK